MCEIERELNRLIEEHLLYEYVLEIIAKNDCVEHEETLKVVELAQFALMETAFIR